MKVTTLRQVRVDMPRPVPQGVEHDTGYWRDLALKSRQQLQHAENKIKDLSRAADENRDRMTKAKRRQESGQAKVSELTMANVALSLEVESLRGRLVEQESFKQRLWELWREL